MTERYSSDARVLMDADDELIEWLEAARQAFMWRYFYDDCGRSSERHVSSDLCRDRVVIAGSGVRVKEGFGTTTTEQAA